MADRPAVPLRDQFEHIVAGGDQQVDQSRFASLPEGGLFNATDRVAVLLGRLTDGDTGHDSSSPSPILAPRRNSPAAIGLPPARCNSVNRTAPSPQATVSRSSRMRPADPSPSAMVARSSFTRSA